MPVFAFWGEGIDLQIESKKVLKKPDLSKAHILIADGDKNMGDVLWHTLQHMGLVNLTRAKNGRDALDILKDKSVDLLITEWEMEHVDGLSLLQSLRRSEDPFFTMLPVLVLTGRAEKHDVELARDAGVTEFLVKPYSARTLFNRLEHIIDHPRDFIMAPNYIGPDRRRSHADDQDSGERRVNAPKTLPVPPARIESTLRKSAHRVAPEFQLRKKMGLMHSLASVITPELLRSAQLAIESFEDQSLKWIADDIASLERAFQMIVEHKTDEAVEEATSHLLSIKSRAGTFNFELPSQIAFSLYSFLRNGFEPGNMQHVLVLQKHIEVMKIILSRQVKGMGGVMEQELMQGLSMLRNKLVHAHA